MDTANASPSAPSRFCLTAMLPALLAGLMLLGGCVRRTLTITTDPPGALVYLNNQEVGRSSVSTDFLWYGDYDVVIRKDGFETVDTNWPVTAPWYQVIPLDFFAEVLWPGAIHDERSRHFVLSPAEQPSTDQLLERAREARSRAFDPRG